MKLELAHSPEHRRQGETTMTIDEIESRMINGTCADDMAADLWNSEVGRPYDSPAAVLESLQGGNDIALMIAARQWMQLPVFE